jgi:hypothetical protein
MFCRIRGVSRGGIKSIQDWKNPVDFNQWLIAVAKALKALPTVFEVLKETLILGFPLRSTG